MKLLIEMPEKEYEYLKAHHSHKVFYGDAIANGKPLDNVLDDIKSEIGVYESDCILQGGTDECEQCNSNVFGSIYRIIDKYKGENA